MQDILEKANDAFFKASKENKGSGGEGKKFRYDYRKDGKLDITFIRTSKKWKELKDNSVNCLLYTSPSPRDRTRSRMPSSA